MDCVSEPLSSLCVHHKMQGNLRLTLDVPNAIVVVVVVVVEEDEKRCSGSTHHKLKTPLKSRNIISVHKMFIL